MYYKGNDLRARASMQRMLHHITALIDEYYTLDAGAFIEHYHAELILGSADTQFILRRRVLKHIVESRKRDGYSKEQLQDLFARACTILADDIYEHVTDSRGSQLIVEALEEQTSGVVLVVEIMIDSDNTYYIKTAFFRAGKKIHKLLSDSQKQ